MGILESSVENTQVTDFFCYLFGREFQDLDLPDGLPVNRLPSQQLQEADSGDDSAVSFAIMTEGGNGDAFSVDVQQASAEHFARLQEMAETVSAVRKRRICHRGCRSGKRAEGPERKRVRGGYGG